MKKINILAFVLLLTASHFVFSQQDNNKTEEAFLQQIQSSIPIANSEEGLDFSNYAQIQQMGNGNDASINQKFTGTNVPGNVAELIQNGNVNDALLIQTGNGNNHSILQTGNRNTFEASVIGDNNSSIVDQFGNNNMINQNLFGNDMSFILEQNGNNNEINQIKIDQVPRQYQIYQTGNAMSITIINGGL